ncbi:MAG: hypothetical protein LC121_07815 [Anaerolineae bacterium]|nr:hypothetical protein [Anaerolineae bacterium]
MIDNARLENGLIHVSRRYAPTLIPAGWQKAGDYPGALPELARALATYNVLVATGESAQTSVVVDGRLSRFLQAAVRGAVSVICAGDRFTSTSSRCW